jgi:hypothetical protein
MARGEYIARMDADDICLPERFALQVRYLEQHPEVGVLGTNIVFIDADGNALYGGRPRPKDRQPLSPAIIKWNLLWRCPIYHPTVMVRRAVFESTRLIYDPDCHDSEDRELWTRLSKCTVIARLPEVTVYYRVLPTSRSRARNETMHAMNHAITRRELTTLLGTTTSEEGLETLIGVFSQHNHNASRDFIAASDLLFEAYQRFCQQPLLVADQKQIQGDVADRLISIAQQASKYSLKRTFLILCRLRHLSLVHIFSLKTARTTFRIFLNSLMACGPIQQSVSHPRKSM